MQTKLSKKSVSGLSYLVSGLFIFLANAGSVLAENTDGWTVPDRAPMTTPMTFWDVPFYHLEDLVITPLLLIGVAVYALLFLYKIGKWDSKNLKDLHKLGKISLVAAVGVLIMTFVVDLNPYNLSNIMIITFIMDYVVALIVYVLTFVFLLRYFWKLISGDKSSHRK